MIKKLWIKVYNETSGKRREKENALLLLSWFFNGTETNAIMDKLYLATFGSEFLICIKNIPGDVDVSQRKLENKTQAFLHIIRGE